MFHELRSDSRPARRPLAAVTADDIEVILQRLRADGRAVSTYNHYRQHVRALFAWAMRKGYLATNPLERAEMPHLTHARRTRRLKPGEESALLAAASPRLYRLIVAALETGCRRGELLKLQWRDIDHTRGEVHVRAENAKDGEDRVIPITSRLAAVLEMARHDPAGEEFEADAHVFSNEVGEAIANVNRAWTTCILRAHGFTPSWDKRPHEGPDSRGNRRQGGRLTAESRAELDRIDLHFHDLRREAGSRWMEGGMPLHVVQQLLGHADARTTSIYLNATRIGLHESMERFEQFRRQSCTDLAPRASAERGRCERERWG